MRRAAAIVGGMPAAGCANEKGQSLG